MDSPHNQRLYQWLLQDHFRVYGNYSILASQLLVFSSKNNSSLHSDPHIGELSPWWPDSTKQPLIKGQCLLLQLPITVAVTFLYKKDQMAMVRQLPCAWTPVREKLFTDNPNVKTNTEAKMLVSILLIHLETNENFHTYSIIPHTVNCPRIQQQHISQQQPWRIQQPSNGCWTCEVSILGNKTRQHYL